jgi:hypothetical protein
MDARAKEKLRTDHATMVVTRAEEWCVDAASPEAGYGPFGAGSGTSL